MEWSNFDIDYFFAVNSFHYWIPFRFIPKEMFRQRNKSKSFFYVFSFVIKHIWDQSQVNTVWNTGETVDIYTTWTNHSFHRAPDPMFWMASHCVDFLLNKKAVLPGSNKTLNYIFLPSWEYWCWISNSNWKKNPTTIKSLNSIEYLTTNFSL